MLWRINCTGVILFDKLPAPLSSVESWCIFFRFCLSFLQSDEPLNHFIKENPMTEDVQDIDFDKAVKAAGASIFWSEFHDEPHPLPWPLIAAASAAAVVGVGLWMWSRRHEFS
jgi:hypothetical protein